MKKITLLAVLAFNITGFAQQKSTGDVTLSTNMTANITLNNTTQKVTLKLTGPPDRWFALQFGGAGAGSGMVAGQDFVYDNGTTLVDGNMNGYTAFPNIDATNNWTVTSNTVTAGIKTIIAERAFSTGDSNDYTFIYANTSVDMIWARRGSEGYGLNNHGNTNRGYELARSFATLGVDDFSLNNTSSVYPNPSNGNFSVESKTGLDKISIYSLTGALIETIAVKDKSNLVEVSLKNSQKGVYLIQLENDSEKSWKKIIIE
jgi:hypothetical protein